MAQKVRGKRKKVFVGLSGGVDSSVSALLLKKAGYDVTGVFIKVWQPDFIECTWKEDRLDAMRIASLLNIPFITLDLEKAYKQGVVDYMIAEYKAGRTPNPDVMCNKSVKFGGFLEYALEHGADYIATGHYAQVEEKNGVFKMFVSKDANKDQSYFLWTLGQKELSHTLFPIGHLKKTEVRTIATKHGLITAEKRDSQGLCFIGKIDFKDFLQHYMPQKIGDVIAGDGPYVGQVIGTHRGSLFYTLGERHGFNVRKKGILDTPYYVISKDHQKNTITVSSKVQKNTERVRKMPEKTFLHVPEIHWISGKPKLDSIIHCRSRYRQTLNACQIRENASGYEILLSSSDQYHTPGQSLVFYKGRQCVGGCILP